MADTWLHTLTTHTQHAVAHAAGRLPAGVWLPDQGVTPYRGRG